MIAVPSIAFSCYSSQEHMLPHNMVFGQHYLKIGTSGIVHHLNGASMQLCGPPCDGQAQPSTAGLRARAGFGADESAEDIGA